MEISRADFEKLDIRVGTVVNVEPFPKAKKPAYQLTIDFGQLGLKRSSAQLVSLYEAGTILGKQVIAVVNFPPKQIANFISECLVLGIYNEQGHVVVLQAERQVENGCKIG